MLSKCKIKSFRSKKKGCDTAKNAQSHQQKVDSMESITVAQKEEEDKIDESEITEGNFLQVNCLFFQLLLFHVLFTRFSF